MNKKYIGKSPSVVIPPHGMCTRKVPFKFKVGDKVWCIRSLKGRQVSCGEVVRVEYYSNFDNWTAKNRVVLKTLRFTVNFGFTDIVIYMELGLFKTKKDVIKALNKGLKK